MTRSVAAWFRQAARGDAVVGSQRGIQFQWLCLLPSQVSRTSFQGEMMMKVSQNSTASQLADGKPALSRRAVMAQATGATMALMLSGAMAGHTQAGERGRGRRHGRRRPRENTVEVLPDGVRIQTEVTQILVLQIADGRIALDIALLEDPTNPFYSSLHSGVLNDEMIEQIARIGRRGVDPDDVHRYFALLRGFGLTGLEDGDIIAIVLGIIIAIIIICAIIASSLGQDYEGYED